MERSVEELLSAHAMRFPGSVATLAAPGDGRLISGVTHDSRRVGPGDLFVCVRGSNLDGHRYAVAAAANGAVAVLVDHQIVGLDVNVAQIVVPDTRAAMAQIAAAVFGFPGDRLRLVGITGTNGKTTTAHMVESICVAAGIAVAVIGTLTQKRTTPEATDLQERLAEFVADGIEVAVLEVTSHALELHRVLGLHFEVVVFTNLSQDHLDFHGTIEAYFRAKARLFTSEFADRAIVNTDDSHGRLLRDSAILPTEAVALSDALGLELAPDHSTFRWDNEAFSVPLAGPFNAMNALQAAKVGTTLGIPTSVVARGIAAVKVPGRFERVEAGQPFAVIVDFAHTPDGLERVLQSARNTLGAGQKLISCFGCGGDRDSGKRPQMASIGEVLSDVLVLTSDNPRSESAHAILDQMVSGLSKPESAIIEPDRRAAIARAVASAVAGDVVVVAGKGHEQGQEVKGVTTPFDDRIVVAETLRDLGWTK